jgi:putative phosphoesterase
VTRALVLADTHIRPGRARRLPDQVYAALEDSDVILHAGDVLTADLLHELSGFAPVHAVLGNNDFALAGTLPETLEVEFDGVRVAMIHDSGPTAGREGRMSRRFPNADVVIFGHSHAPLAATGLGGQLLFNPGSPTERRAQPRHTYGTLEFGEGRIVSHRIVPVERQG